MQVYKEAVDDESDVGTEIVYQFPDVVLSLRLGLQLCGGLLVLGLEFGRSGIHVFRVVYFEHVKTLV